MSRKLWIGLGAFAAVIIIAGATAWSLRGEYAAAQITIARAAKNACSCVHISARTLEACIDDFNSEESREVEISQMGPRMRATILAGAISAEAEYEEGYGCRLVD